MKNKKKIGVGLLALCVLAGVWVASHWYTKPEKDSIRIGVLLYQKDDTFVDKIVSGLYERVAYYEEAYGINIQLSVAEAGDSQRTQNEQVKRYVQLGYDVICVNLVDRTSAAEVIDMAMVDGEEIPVVFFNREPVAEDVVRREKVFYVGADAKQSAILQGEEIISCFEEYPEVLDKNGDGILQYVMLEGEMGHQDAIMRSEYSVQTLTNAGMEVQKLGSATADWNRFRASVIMEQWLDSMGNRIELVICNNDDMGLGAADALASKGYQAAVFGIDATEVAIEALIDGRLWSTIDCNGEEQGRAILSLALSAVTGAWDEDGLELIDEHYIRVPLIARRSNVIGMTK